MESSAKPSPGGSLFQVFCGICSFAWLVCLIINVMIAQHCLLVGTFQLYLLILLVHIAMILSSTSLNGASLIMSVIPLCALSKKGHIELHSSRGIAPQKDLLPSCSKLIPTFTFRTLLHQIHKVPKAEICVN